MNLGEILKSAAPMLATAVGGPFAGFAVKALVGALPEEQQASVAAGQNPVEAGLDAVRHAIEQGALDMAKVREAEDSFRLKMAELGYRQVADLEALAQKDRDSARQMQVATRSWVPAVLAVSVTGGFFGILVCMMVGDFRPQNNDALLLMLGSLGTAWGSVIAYYFGSSKGSEAKSELLAQAVVK